VSDQVIIAPAPSLHGTAAVPGDKSMSHRALLLSALAEGTSTISGLSGGDDVRRTGVVISQLGAGVNEHDGVVEVDGGRDRLRPTNQILDFGNSGTGLRLTMGILASIKGTHQLIGDASLSSRPMNRVADPLGLMGAEVIGTGDQCRTPIELIGGELHSISYDVPVPSAQVKSAVLLAGLGASGTTIVHESVRTRPHTEEMIGKAGGVIEILDGPDGRTINVTGSDLSPRAWLVPGDPSQAAFFVVAGILMGAGSVEIEHLYGDETRIGFLPVLQRMGATIETEMSSGLLRVRSTPGSLSGTTIDAREIPSLDEVPILAVAAAAAEGLTRFVDVGELRIKESDRFSRSIDLVLGLGARAWAEGEDFIVEGRGSASAFGSLVIDAGEDHRMAMAGAIAGLVGSGATIRGFSTVQSSFPGFLRVVDSLR
jgi:3-phosphoshikimate 1-carboxyvinyltransferase